jgi:hypothetical protein
MSKRYAMACIMIVGLALGSTPALARDHGHDRDHDRDDRKESRERGYDRDRHHGRGDHDRDHDRNGEPRGWSHGKKEGWEKSDCDLPPGQAKKRGCGESRHEHHDAVVTRTPTNVPVRSRTPIARPPLRRTVTPKKTNTLEPKNAAEALKAKTQAQGH